MAQHTVIDLCPAETGLDGVRVYRPPAQALMFYIASGVLWLMAEHPRETFITALGGVCGYVLYDSFRKPEPKPRRRTLRGKVKR
jgi:hypothetical protein